MSRARTTSAALLCAVLAVAALQAVALPSASAISAHRPVADTLTDAAWVRVDPAHPNILLLGSSGWMWRSTDYGKTWRDSSAALGDGYGLDCGSGSSSCLDGPPRFSVDGSAVYVTETDQGLSPSSYGSPSLASSDGGAHWSALGSGGGYGAGDYGIVPSPLAGQVAYAINHGGQTSSNAAEITTDGGAHWNVWNLDPTVFKYGDSVLSVVASASDPHSYYANVGPVDDSGAPLPGGYTIHVSRDGAAFVRLPSPVGKGFTGFTLEQDLPDGAGLVGIVMGTHAPADRRYLSQDGGKTWHVGVCPGDLRGRCPQRVLVNAFGAGKRFVVDRLGIFPFTGAHSVGPRLPISAALPLKAGIQLVDVDAGVLAGAPAYLLTTDAALGGANVLYRTKDGGHSWQRVVLPATAP